MHAITVYGKPVCVECNVTFRRLDRAGIEQADATSPKILCLMRHTNSGEYLQAPVVYAGPDNHFGGFRPERLKSLAA
jgi:glutaredoxin-like protein NrdH